MNRLGNALKTEANLTTTENGAVTLKSSNSAVLDLFATGGALRTRPQDVRAIVLKAADEDLSLTLKTIFYLRDIRGGQGERETFKQAIVALANSKLLPGDLISHIPTFGRFDDLLCLLDTPLKRDVVDFIRLQLFTDVESNTPSLAAKWLPSENTSSRATRAMASKLRGLLGLTPKTYRNMLTALRSKIRIVERQMCARDWLGINYQSVPSNAAMRYRKAFAKHDEPGYTKFLADVKAGKQTINSGTLFPYDIVGKYLTQGAYAVDETLEAQWKALPDLFDGKESKGIVIADVSGSMRGQPLNVSISLAMYIAERNKGPFHNMFMTFSSTPEIQVIKGNTLCQRVANLSQAAWEMSTNLQAAFAKLLEVAISSGATADEMPDTLYIVSDMEFDRCCHVTNYDAIRSQYHAAGFELPTIVFWNVNSRNDQSPIRQDESGTMLVSGCSPSILKNVLAKASKTPYELMLEVINGERYNLITC